MTENIDPNFIGDGMYREHILDHYKHPRNNGQIEDPTISQTEKNPTCGDVITVQMKLEGDTIKDIKFSGQGCAISQACISMVAEEIEGKSVSEAQAVSREHVLELLGIPVGPVRTKCAMLGTVAMQNALKQYDNN